ncbi:glycosyltransferase [Rhodocyclaceae bacterium SMB388]
MTQLRVLMVSDVYFPRVNGVSTSIETFVRALPDFGVDVTVVAPRYGSEPNTPGIIRVPGRPVPRDPEDRLLNWREMHRRTRDAAARCDLVHIQTPFVAHYAGLAAATANHLPVMLTYHTLFEEYLHHYAPMLPAKLLKYVARRFSRAQCNAMDRIVVPSSAMRERLLAYGIHRPVEILPTGIPLDDFEGGDRRRFRARHAIAEHAPLALFVGRVAHEKNIGFLLDVTATMRARMPDFMLMIAGEGPARAPLERDAKRKGLTGNLRFVGYLDRHTELPDCYAAADAFVFASRTETQGLVLIEAMAARLPVVALAEMGTRDILLPQQGAIVAPDDVDGFATALHTLLQDHDLHRRLAGDAKTFSQNWSSAAMANRLAALYRDILDGSARRPTGDRRIRADAYVADRNQA